MEDYQIVKRIGKGSQGFVFLAKDKEGKHVAIKQIVCKKQESVEDIKKDVCFFFFNNIY